MKAVNLIETDKKYIHPLTRTSVRPHRLTVTSDGEFIEVPGEVPLHRTTLTDEDIANYYYLSTNQVENNPLIGRDMGSVKWLVRHYGLDRTLFAIDALISSYNVDEERSSIPPALISASNFVLNADERFGEIKTIARQYGILSAVE